MSEILEKIRDETPKLVTRALAVSTAVGLAACGGEPKEPIPTPEQTTNQNTEQAPSADNNELGRGDYAVPNGGTYADYLARVDTAPTNTDTIITVGGVTMNCNDAASYDSFLPRYPDFDPASDWKTRCNEDFDFPQQIFNSFANEIELFVNTNDVIPEGTDPQIVAGLLLGIGIGLYTEAEDVEEGSIPFGIEEEIQFEYDLVENANEWHRDEWYTSQYPGLSDKWTHILNEEDVRRIYFTARYDLFKVGEQPRTSTDSTANETPETQTPDPTVPTNIPDTQQGDRGEGTSSDPLLFIMREDIKEAITDPSLTIKVDGVDYYCTDLIGRETYAEMAGIDVSEVGDICQENQYLAFSVVRDYIDVIMNNPDVKASGIDKLTASIIAFHVLIVAQDGDLEKGRFDYSTLDLATSYALNTTEIIPSEYYLSVGRALGVAGIYPDTFTN